MQHYQQPIVPQLAAASHYHHYANYNKNNPSVGADEQNYNETLSQIDNERASSDQTAIAVDNQLESSSAGQSADWQQQHQSAYMMSSGNNHGVYQQPQQPQSHHQHHQNVLYQPQQDSQLQQSTTSVAAAAAAEQLHNAQRHLMPYAAANAAQLYYNSTANKTLRQRHNQQQVTAGGYHQIHQADHQQQQQQQLAEPTTQIQSRLVAESISNNLNESHHVENRYAAVSSLMHQQRNVGVQSLLQHSQALAEHTLNRVQSTTHQHIGHQSNQIHNHQHIHNHYQEATAHQSASSLAGHHQETAQHQQLQNSVRCGAVWPHESYSSESASGHLQQESYPLSSNRTVPSTTVQVADNQIGNNTGGAGLLSAPATVSTAAGGGGSVTVANSLCSERSCSSSLSSLNPSEVAAHASSSRQTPAPPEGGAAAAPAVEGRNGRSGNNSRIRSGGASGATATRGTSSSSPSSKGGASGEKALPTRREAAHSARRRLCRAIEEDITYQDEDIEHTTTHITVTNVESGRRVKLSNKDLIGFSVRDLNKIVSGFPKEAITKLKQRRRTLKNRGYAQNCRYKRLNQKNNLEKENELLRQENSNLNERLVSYMREIGMLRFQLEKQQQDLCELQALNFSQMVAAVQPHSAQQQLPLQYQQPNSSPTGRANRTTEERESDEPNAVVKLEEELDADDQVSGSCEPEGLSNE